MQSFTADPEAPAAVSAVRAFHAQLASLGEGLDDAGRIDLIRALEELKSGAAAAQARVSVEFDASQRAAQAATGVPAERQGRGIAGQVALARKESPHRGSRRLGAAKAWVAEMPFTLAALEEGRLTEWRAELMVRETALLSLEHRAEVDREVCGDPTRLDGMGDTQGGGRRPSCRAPARPRRRGPPRQQCRDRPQRHLPTGARHDGPDQLRCCPSPRGWRSTPP